MRRLSRIRHTSKAVYESSCAAACQANKQSPPKYEFVGSKAMNMHIVNHHGVRKDEADRARKGRKTPLGGCFASETASTILPQFSCMDLGSDSPASMIRSRYGYRIQGRLSRLLIFQNRILLHRNHRDECHRAGYRNDSERQHVLQPDRKRSRSRALDGLLNSNLYVRMLFLQQKIQDMVR